MQIAVSGWYMFKALGLFTVILMIAGSRWQTPSKFGPANGVTVARAFLVSIAAGAIGEPLRPDIATFVVLISIIAVAFDGLDGWVARKTGMTTAYGARFDMEVDALMIQVLAILVWQYGKAGPWILGSGLMRYAFVAAGWVWTWMRAPLPPTLRGKAICIVQTAALLVALWPNVAPPASVLISAAGLGVLSYSFLTDTIWLWRHTS